MKKEVLEKSGEDDDGDSNFSGGVLGFFKEDDELSDTGSMTKTV